MKKIIAALLAVLMTLSCACAEDISAGIGKSLLTSPVDNPDFCGLDFLNAEMEVAPWPELPENGIPVFFEENKCLVLPTPGVSNGPYLYNAATGVSANLYYYEEDLPLWKKMVTDELSYLGYTEEDVEELSQGRYVDTYFYIVCGQDTLTSLNILPGEIVVNYMTASFVIDTEERSIRPTEADILMGGGVSVDWLNEPEADYVYRDSDGNETSVLIEGDPGYEYIPYCVDFEWNAVAMTVCSAKKQGGNANFALGFAEGYTEGKMEFVDLGTYAAGGGPTNCRLCGTDAALAYNEGALTVYPLLLARRGEPQAKALIWDGETMSAVDVSELIGENGTVSMKGYDYRYLYPKDVSADGRYAALIDGSTGDLLVMDTETLETRCLVTQAEMDALGYGDMMYDLAGWFMGDTIMGKNGYHLKFVFE